MAVLFLISLDQICPKWIELDQIGFLANQKTLLKKDTNSCFILDFCFDQICPKWITLISLITVEAGINVEAGKYL